MFRTQTFCSAFVMEQVTAASLPAPEQDARSGGRPSERDRVLNNWTSPRHVPPLSPACTETLPDFGNGHFRGDCSLLLFRLGLAVARVALRREPARHCRSLTRTHRLGKRQEQTLCLWERATRTQLAFPRGPTRKELHSASCASPGCVPRAGSAFPTRNVASLVELVSLSSLAKF